MAAKAPTNGEAGGDLLQGNSGDDSLIGGEGADTVYGGQGDDVINTSTSRVGPEGEVGDWAHGNLGDDQISGGGGRDTLYGGKGDDFINGGYGDDLAFGDLGDDILNGGFGADTLVGGAGSDILAGALRADNPNSGDNLDGGEGDDSLFVVGNAAATLSGGAGSDTIVSVGSGQDIVFGGEGKDRFEFVCKTAPSAGLEAKIMDWEAVDQIHFAAVSITGEAAPGAADILPRSYSEFVATDYATALSIANEHISAAGAIYVAAQVGSDVYVFADTGDPTDGANIAVVLVGRTLADISLQNFV